MPCAFENDQPISAFEGGRLLLSREGSSPASRLSPRNVHAGLLPVRAATSAPVGSPTRRQTTVARYAGGEHRRTDSAQELQPRRSRRSRTATWTVERGPTKTVFG